MEKYTQLKAIWNNLNIDYCFQIKDLKNTIKSEKKKQFTIGNIDLSDLQIWVIIIKIS